MTPLVEVVGWTLVHFVWQGALVAVAISLALEFLVFRSAHARYIVSCLGLFAMLAAPGITLAVATASSSSPAVFAVAEQESQSFDSFNVRGGPAFRQSLSPSKPAVFNVSIDAVLTGIVFLWGAGVMVLLARMAGGWWRVRRLHRRALASALSAWQPTCEQIAARLGLTRIVKVVESAIVNVPTVVGWLQPVIVLPVSALSGLTPVQVEAILAHELAHIHRHDFIVNLLQTIAETLLFYHPAVWWISARVRAEREYCCDDVAVTMTGDAVGYASALAELETRRSLLVVAANGGSLVDRVGRLLRVQKADDSFTTGWIVTLVLTAMFVSGAGVVQWLPEMIFEGRSGISAQVQPAVHVRDENFRMRWSEGFTFREARLAGELTFNNDLTDISALSSGGVLVLREWVTLLPRSVEIRSDGTKLVRRYFVAGFERPWTADTDQWLADRLPTLVRRSGLGARSRVRHIFATKGIDGVFEEINLLEGDYARRIYFSELLAVADPPGIITTTRALTMAGTLIQSDYELAELLKESAPAAAGTDLAITRAYLDASSRIGSDYEHRRALVALFETSRLTAEAAALAVQSARGIHSDWERAETLRAAAEEGRLGTGEGLVNAVIDMHSDYEKRRVLLAILRERSVDLELEKRLLGAAETIDSDYECAELLLAFLRQYGLNPATRAAFFDAVETLDSPYERRRVLSALVRKDPIGREALRDLLKSASTMGSDYDRAELLLAVLKKQPIDSATRESILDVVDRIGSSYDQDRVLVALVRAERR